MGHVNKENLTVETIEDEVRHEPVNEYKNNRATLKEFRKTIQSKMPIEEIVNTIARLARGIWIQTTDDNDEKIIYKKAPSLDALTYLCDQMMGKAKVRIEHGLDEDMRPILRFNVPSFNIPSELIEAKKNNNQDKIDIVEIEKLNGRSSSN